MNTGNSPTPVDSQTLPPPSSMISTFTAVCAATYVCFLLFALYLTFVHWSSKSGAGKSNSNEEQDVASSSQASESNLKEGKHEKRIDDFKRIFKQFDTVDDCSDHHYRTQAIVGTHRFEKSSMKKIMEEWKILQDNLPETIFVRAYESQMNLLRAAIIGADGTPYHDGIFFFDIMFPSSYPLDPPMVHFHSGGLGLNPNLYDNGYVCLSLLGTWFGSKNERWIPDKSTMLQVLLSIQALILNSKPFYNEPLVGWLKWGNLGENSSKSYNEDVFILSMKTMVYSINKPPKHFEGLVAAHFRSRAFDILKACRAYSEGADIGSDIRKRVKKAKKEEFKSSLAQVVELLAKALCKCGAIRNTKEFNLYGV